MSSTSITSRIMRTFIVLMLPGATVLAADTDIQHVTTVRTNASGSISTKDIFMRGGQTNLVRNTSSKDGLVQIRVNRFYHDGALVGFVTASPDSASTISEAGSPYSLDAEYGSSNQLKYVAIIRKDGQLVDAFACTNGVLLPVEGSKLRGLAEIGTDATELISHGRNTSPEEFSRKVEQLIKKHNNE